MRVRFSLPAPTVFDIAEVSAIKYCSKCGAETVREVPDGDSKERDVCHACNTVHYVNPRVVVGCVPEYEGQILLCLRAIEPRKGYWTVPAGFMEIGETMQEGAARETWEEALARVDVGPLFASVDVVQAGQVHVFFKATFDGNYGTGAESLDAGLFAPDDIPWDDIAFPSVRFALERYLDDAGRDRGTHLHRAPHIPKHRLKLDAAKQS
ncbi:MAG: NUDIX hydrolase [Pseudomonadota bacterium]